MLETKTGVDSANTVSLPPGSWPRLRWAWVMIWLVAASMLCITMQRFSGSQGFAWLPLGMAAALVLRQGGRMAIPAGIVTMLSGPWLLGPGANWSASSNLMVLTLSSLALGVATVIGLIGLRAVMGAAGRRLTRGLVTLTDAGRLVIFGMPVPTLSTTLAWYLADVESGGLNSGGDPNAWAGFAASQMLGLLAGLPLTVSLLPSPNGRFTYTCRAVRAIRVAPGMLLLVMAVIASWLTPASLIDERVQVVFILTVMVSFLWLTTHSGWFSASVAVLVVAFGNAQVAFGGVLMLIPLLSFVILLTASMEQRSRDLSLIRDQYEELQALLEATGAALFQIDLDGRIRFRNPAAGQLIDSISESRGRVEKFTDAFDDRSQRRIQAAIRVALTGRRRECEVSIRRNASPRSMHLAVFTPLHGIKGRIQGCSIVLLNLATAQRREMIRLRKQEKDFGSVANALVHDVSNFAMAVGGAVSLVRENRTEGMNEVLIGIEDTCFETARRAQRIRHAVPNREPGRLVDLGRIASERLRRHQRQKRISIAAVTCEAGTIVDIPESFAEFIVDEFIGNSMDAMGPETPEIALACRQTDENKVELKIGDNGPGIPDAIQPRIGRSFVTTKGGGRGLGLRAIATGIRAAGGRLRLESSPSGTVLRITLPLIRSVKPNNLVVVSSPRDQLAGLS